MTDPMAADLPSPAFHADTDALRFWVLTPNQVRVGASVSSSVLHFCFKGQLDGSDAAHIYTTNRIEIDAAVVRRVAAGSLEPVMLREYDFPTPRR